MGLSPPERRKNRERFENVSKGHDHETSDPEEQSGRANSPPMVEDCRSSKERGDGCQCQDAFQECQVHSVLPSNAHVDRAARSPKPLTNCATLERRNRRSGPTKLLGCADGITGTQHSVNVDVCINEPRSGDIW